MTKDAPAFDFYPERWLVGVAALSDLEQLAYLRLLCHEWLAGDLGLPDDLAALRRLAGKGVTPALLEKFPVGTDGKRRNPRLEIVRAEQRARIAKRSEQRKAAALRRWHPEQCGGDAVALREDVRNRYGDDAHHPPPTTHPILSTTPARSFGCTLEEARGYAVEFSKINTEGLNIPMPVVSSWHDDRSSVGWVKVKGMNEIPIADWKADLRGYAKHYDRNERSGRASQSSPRPPAVPVKLTTSSKSNW